MNGDGRDDLMLHFKFEETGLNCESTEVELYGQTITGDDIGGVDSITMKDNKKNVVDKMKNFLSF